MANPEDAEGILEEEYEHVPVPVDRRQKTRSVAAVWFGFPMVLTSAVFGGVIAYSLGFWLGLAAVVVGNIILLIYVGLLSYIAGETGLNFALQAKRTFGQYGYIAASAFLATIVVGWYAFQTGLTGATIYSTFGWNELTITVIAAVLYTGITFIGIRALSILGMVAAPLYVILGIVAVGLLLSEHKLSAMTAYTGSAGADAFSFGAGVTIVVAAFADSGTMTADFTRWAKDGKQAVVAAFSAFPIANTVAQIFGVIIVAGGAALNPATSGGDFTPVLNSHGPFLSALALIFVFVSLGSVCTHCLYNGAIGWSHISGSKMRVLTIILGIIGGLAAVAGVWNFFLAWLSLLGVFVPPIGAIMITDQILMRRMSYQGSIKAIRPTAFAAWALGAAAGIVIHYTAPEYSEAVVGGLVGGICYYFLSFAIKREIEPT